MDTRTPEAVDIDGSRLLSMDDGDLEDYVGIKSKFARQEVLLEIKALVSSSTHEDQDPPPASPPGHTPLRPNRNPQPDLHVTSGATEESTRRRDSLTVVGDLPAAKATHYFCSQYVDTSFMHPVELFLHHTARSCTASFHPAVSIWPCVSRTS